MIYVHTTYYANFITLQRAISSRKKHIEGFLQNSDLFVEAGEDHWKIRMKSSVFSQQK